MSDLILPPNTPSTMQSQSKTIDGGIKHFISEYNAQKFDAFGAAWVSKDDGQVRLFFGTTHPLNSQRSYEALYYLNTCLQMSFENQVKSYKEQVAASTYLTPDQKEAVKELSGFTPTLVEPSINIKDLLDLLRPKRSQIQALTACYARGMDYKFTHGIEGNVLTGDPEYLELATNLIYGTASAIASVHHLFKFFKPQHKRLIQIVNPDHREILGIPGNYS